MPTCVKFFLETLDIGVSIQYNPLMDHSIPLGPREKEVLGHVVQGKTNREIAELIGVSVSAVDSYLTTARLKMGARNRADAVRIFMETKDLGRGEVR